MANPTAIGCGCLLGAGGMSHLLAAEWSVQPVLSVATDYDSDRNLQQGTSGSEEAILYTDLRLQRAIENTAILIEPKFDLRRYSAYVWGPGTDRSLNAQFTWSGQRLKASLSGSIASTTTLNTELTETGIIDGSTRRRSDQVAVGLDWMQTERHVAFVTASYSSTSYSGPPLVELELPGYHYLNAALGERFVLSEKLTVSVSAFGDSLTSALVGNSSHEEGGQAEVSYQRTEANSFDLAVGESRRSLDGRNSNGTDITASAVHNFERGSATLSYVRSLVPYGTGVLVQRQMLTAALGRPLTPTLDLNLAVLRIQNDASTVRLGRDRPYYTNTTVGLNWKMGESWSLQPLFGTSWSRAIGLFDPNTGERAPGPKIFEWRAGVTLVWQPFPASKSR